MARWFAAVSVLVVAFAGCGGGGGEAPPGRAAADSRTQAATVDPCALLTSAEIEQVLTNKVESAEPSDVGATQVCNYYGPGSSQLVSLVVAGGMPAVSNSSEMAAWRAKQTGSYGDMKFIIEPIEGLGVPAIRNEIEGMRLSTVEVAVRGRLLDVTTGSLEHSKALAVKAIARMP